MEMIEDDLLTLCALEAICVTVKEQKNATNPLQVSMVKVINCLQNNALIKELLPEPVEISEILTNLRGIFTAENVQLVDGQLTFVDTSLEDVQDIRSQRHNKFFEVQWERIKKLDDRITALIKEDSQDTKEKSKTPTVSSGESNSSVSVTSNTTGPNREKLLKLYRDTVLKKLRSKKGRMLDQLYRDLDADDQFNSVVRRSISLLTFTTETPHSIHELQLTLQRLICDALMGTPSESENWNLATQIQSEFDDTVLFMRRALE